MQTVSADCMRFGWHARPQPSHAGLPAPPCTPCMPSTRYTNAIYKRAARPLGRVAATDTPSTTSPAAVAEDAWIASYLAANPPVSDNNTLGALQKQCAAALNTTRMPTTRNEEFRFTDISPLLQSTIMAPPTPSEDTLTTAAALADTRYTQEVVHLLVLDGVLQPQLSRNMELLPEAVVYVGPVSGAPAESVKKLGSQTQARGGVFATLNGATAADALCVVVSDNVEVLPLIHVLHVSSGSSDKSTRIGSTPRMYIAAGRHAHVTIAQEYISLTSTSPCYTLVNSVSEVHVAQGGQVSLDYVNLEGPGSLHFHTTLVEQDTDSAFRLTEARVGGGLTRHDVGVLQGGPDTFTSMRSFLLAGKEQLHDLHSKLRLTHPRGEADQLHKCIAAASSARGVFDGNVKVEREAQQTDARQLSRNLLLVPKATVNVKPNLQIIADDVKCTHGCAVSDLEEEQLFYFLARGIDAQQARQTLVYSFGAEVVGGLACKSLARRVEHAIKEVLVEAAA